MLRSFSDALASPLSAHPTDQEHDGLTQGHPATPPARQIGIRQRSLRKHCRLGRATELVFITALGAAVMIGGGASANGTGGAGGMPAVFAGAGGAASPTGTGGTGGVGAELPVQAGAGGGGAGQTGGAGGVGGSLTFGSVGLGGATPGAPGGNGRTDGVAPVGHGGGGGAHGFVGAALPGVAVTGGNGGAGAGDTSPLLGIVGGGGGGGGGGFGAVVTGNGPLGTLTTTVIGGNGGAGGAGAPGGNGGSGGIGLLFTDTTGISFTIASGVTVAGGDGGAGGGTTLASVGGLRGNGGDGILGSNLSITNNGTINAGTGATKGNAITFTGGTNTLTFGSATSGMGGDIAVTGTLRLNAAAGGTTVANRITGTGSLIQNSANTLTLLGENTYAGTTTISAGRLQIGSGGMSGSIGSGDVINNGNLTINRGNALTFDNLISGSGTLTKAGAGTLTLSGANTYSGSTTISGGTLDVTGSIASSFLSMSGATSRLIVDGASLSDTAEVSIGSGTLQLTGNEAIGSLLSNSNGTLELGSSTLTVTDGAGDFEGEIRGTGGLTVTGGDQRFTGTNSFTGAVNVTGGTAFVGGLASTRVNVSGGRLSGVLNTAAALSLSGTGTFSNGNEQTIASVTQTGGTLSANRNLTVSGAYALGGGSLTGTQTVTAGTFTMSGGSIDAGATVTATGARSLSGGTIAGVLGGAGAASVTGTVGLTGTLSGGPLIIGTGGALNVTGTINSATTVDGGTLSFGTGSSLLSNNLTVNAGTVAINHSITSGPLSGTGGTMTVGAGTILNVNQSSNSTYAGVITGAGALQKTGAGRLTLSGAHTYTAATNVVGGTLDVTGSIASSSVTLRLGTRLIVDGASLSDTATVNVRDGRLQLTGDETVGNVSGNGLLGGTIELGANTLTVTSGSGSFAGAITGTGGVSVTGGSHSFEGTSSFTGAINVSGGSAFFSDNAATAVNLSGGTLSARLNSGTDFDISGTGTFVNTLDQTVASLSQTGGTLSADRNLTVSGAYDLGGGSLTGTGTGTVTAGSFTMSGGSIGAFARVNSDGARSLSGGTIAGRLGGAGAAAVTGTVGLSGTLSGGAVTLGAGGVLNVDGGALTADVVLAGGQLRGTGTSTLSFGELSLGAGQAGTIAAADGRTLTLNIADAATRAAGSTLTFGEAGGTGVVTLAMGNFSTVSVDGTTQTNLAGGTVTIGNTFTGLSFFSASPTSIAAGATLDMGGNNTELSGLSGAGQVTSGVAGAARLSLAAPSGSANSFSGQITDGAGTVSLFKSGSGTMILSGANGYSGTTTITQGVLQIGDGGTSGSIGAGNVTNTAVLAFNRSDALTFGNVISGAGSVTQAGSGTTTLSGANSYAGVTQVTAGTLNIAHATALGTTAGGTVVTGGATLALSGGITVAEDLTLNGTGLGGTGALLAAQGDNVLTGTVSLGSDTQIAAAAAQGLRLTGGITGAGQNLTFTGAGTIAVDGNITTGAGGLTKTGTGSLILAGTNSFTGAVTVDAGTLSLNGATGTALADTARVAIAAGATLDIGTSETIGALTGAGSVALSGGALTLGDGTDTIFSGGMSGGGSLVKQGSGTLVLSGANSFSGGMIINAGRVAVDGSITAAIMINAGGALGGSGRVGAVTVASGGTLAAGNSIGTLSTGDLTLNAGSTLAVEVDPANPARADLIASTGTVTINGATLRHVGEAGSYDPSRTWRVITATGGVSGSFATVTSDYTFLNASAVYGTNSVDLTLTRNDLSFGSIARTRNQRTTATGLETARTSAVYNAFATLSGDTARNALDQLSGAGLAAAGAGLAEQGQDMAHVVLGQMTSGASGTTGGMTMSTRGPASTTTGLWASSFGADSRRALEGIDTDLRHTGLMLGKDFALETWQLGVIGAVGRNATATADLATTTTADTYSLGVHAQASFGATDLRAGLIGTYADLSSTRDVSVGALNQTLTASYSARMLTGFAEVSHDFTHAAASASPFLRLTHHVLQDNGFAETGGSAALTQAARRSSQSEMTLGGHLAGDFRLGSLPARLSADLSLSRQIGSVADVTYRIANSAPFAIAGATGAGTRAQFGLGLDLQLAPASSLALFAVASDQGGRNGTRIGAVFNLRF